MKKIYNVQKCVMAGCTETVKGRMRFCKTHWSRVPDTLKAHIGIVARQMNRGEIGAKKRYEGAVDSALKSVGLEAKS